MIWTYVISIVLALIWFLVFRYLAVKPYSRSEYEFVTISKGMVLLSAISLLIPIVNISYFVIAPIAYTIHLEEDSYDMKLKVRENDTFSETIKTIGSWLKDSAFLVLFFFCLMGCCPVKDTSKYLEANKQELHFKYSGSNYPEERCLESFPFEDNGHDMIYYENMHANNFCIIHSPDCKKCDSKNSSNMNNFLGW